jgi:ABC-type transport system involved in multi-copper enzyme maturation permease subunit
MQGTTRNPLDYAHPGSRGRVTGGTYLVAFIAAALLLTIPSLVVGFLNANDEPYFGTIRKSDALVQVGLGSVLMTLWVAWTAALLLAVTRNRVHAAALALVVWSVFAVCFLGSCASGYLDDLIESQAGVGAAAGSSSTTQAAPGH